MMYSSVLYIRFYKLIKDGISLDVALVNDEEASVKDEEASVKDEEASVKDEALSVSEEEAYVRRPYLPVNVPSLGSLATIISLLPSPSDSV